MNKPQLLLFAKVPVAGKVKTRLQSHLTPEQCAQVAEVLLEESLRKACGDWNGTVVLAIAEVNGEGASHPFIQSINAKYEFEIRLQSAGDLGQRMNNALIEANSPALILGCDVPHLDGEILSQAYDLLEQGQSVIGPSADGGYYAIGLQKPNVELFSNVAWGGEQVLAQTLDKAKQAKIEFDLLPQTHDIDEWQDLIKAANKVPKLAAIMP